MRLLAFVVAASVLATSSGCKKKHRPEPMNRVWLGERHAFGTLKKGGLAGWGEGTSGQLGDGTLTSRPLPGIVMADDLPRELSLGDAFTCGIFRDDVVRCWGDGALGRLGDGSMGAHTIVAPSGAKAVAGPDGGALHAASLASRGARACAVMKDTGRVWCWGSGRGPFEPHELEGRPVAELAMSDERLCAVVTTPRMIRCFPLWEAALDPADAGTSRHVDDASDTVLAGLEVRGLVAGASHFCALGSVGKIHCWGQNDSGQLGDGTTIERREPVLVTGIDAAASLAAGARFTCARTLRTAVACWGANDAYQLVDGTTTSRAVPSPIPGLVEAVEIVAAHDSACVRVVDGFVRCWGKNGFGQLGDGTRDDHPVPMPVKW